MAPQMLKTITALTGLLASLGAAAPVDKRDLVWVTDVVWTTVDVTTTLYPTQTGGGSAGEFYAQTTTSAVPQVTVLPTSSSEAPVVPQPSAPAPQVTTTSAPAAPAPPAPEPTTTSTSSTLPAPEPTTTSTSSTSAAPEPSTTYAAPAPSASSGSSSGSAGAQVINGSITYYTAGPGSCGETSDGLTENVIALSAARMTAVGADPSVCGKTITIKYNGKTAQGTVLDKCPGCDADHLDLSEHLFKELADETLGHVEVEWWFDN